MNERFGNLRTMKVPDIDPHEQAMFFDYIEGFPVVFDPRNTHLRVFASDRDNCYNYLVHTLPGDHILKLLLDDPELEPFKDRLLNGDYPVYHSTFPDEDVLNWHANEVRSLQRQPTPED
ncbi:MAG TPA: hypothetical protein VFI84_04535 [Candidatus Saccharimonadales bacterium]|nr:hypothetical protein [Candidatus Saccharimonadales bacterium]